MSGWSPTTVNLRQPWPGSSNLGQTRPGLLLPPLLLRRSARGTRALSATGDCSPHARAAPPPPRCMHITTPKSPTRTSWTRHRRPPRLLRRLGGPGPGKLYQNRRTEKRRGENNKSDAPGAAPGSRGRGAVLLHFWGVCRRPQRPSTPRYRPTLKWQPSPNDRFVSWCYGSLGTTITGPTTPGRCRRPLTSGQRKEEEWSRKSQSIPSERYFDLADLLFPGSRSLRDR